MTNSMEKQIWELSKNRWILVIVLFILNVPRIILSGVSPSQDPFRFFVNLATGLIGSYLVVRIWSMLWDFFTKSPSEGDEER